MNRSLDEAREALRQRQGDGARYDAAAAPARDLDWARRGTAYFARLLNGLGDADLDGPSSLEGRLRREIVAHVGYHARTLSEIVSSAREAQPNAEPVPMRVDIAEVERRATQPARALRNLFAHSKVHLNVEWRDLDDAQWRAVVANGADQEIAVRDTPWLRARAIWLHAIDLGAGGRLTDAPPDFVEALVADLTAERARDDDVAADEGRRFVIRAAETALWLSGRRIRRPDGVSSEMSPSPVGLMNL
ncbi:maleylpyruvate isomerase N-terminal domain-containing protein [Hoeflea sp. WL0058]|uniref:Maleylpyruvate isomerase N-terminal domain-containing protein n=1 Tax=Flavimaribacter sediminis TaxID=2865987 RepID=A0AAE3D0R9_9HYPH|nr:maleylpyruvate isomerase N-terminal domain-containing protein [Flavimaribacter sediminis]